MASTIFTSESDSGAFIHLRVAFAIFLGTVSDDLQKPKPCALASPISSWLPNKLYSFHLYIALQVDDDDDDNEEEECEEDDDYDMKI